VRGRERERERADELRNGKRLKMRRMAIGLRRAKNLWWGVVMLESEFWDLYRDAVRLPPPVWTVVPSG